MRLLENEEIAEVSGAARVWVDLGFFGFELTGEDIMSGYNSAVNGMTDFFMWWDPQDLVQES